jgi:hypothetical protein
MTFWNILHTGHTINIIDCSTLVTHSNYIISNYIIVIFFESPGSQIKEVEPHGHILKRMSLFVGCGPCRQGRISNPSACIPICGTRAPATLMMIGSATGATGAAGGATTAAGPTGPATCPTGATAGSPSALCCAIVCNLVPCGVLWNRLLVNLATLNRVDRCLRQPQTKFFKVACSNDTKLSQTHGSCSANDHNDPYW